MSEAGTAPGSRDTAVSGSDGAGRNRVGGKDVCVCERERERVFVC